MNTILSGKKILFATVPAEGHFNPLTGLAKHLQEQGCDVRWYCTSMFAERLKNLDIEHFPLVNAPDINAGNIFKLIPELNTNDPVKRYNIYRTQYAKRSSEYFEDIKDLQHIFAYDLIIADSFLPAIPFLKHKLNVPIVTIGIVPLAEDSVDTAPYSHALPPPENKETRALYADLYAKNPDRCKEATDLFESRLAAYNIPYTRSSIENRLVKEADLLLQIGIPEFEYYRSDLGENIRFIGALIPYTASNKSEKWYDARLEKYNKIVLVTQGTVEGDTTKILEPTLQAFKNSDVLVIATTGGNGTLKLRETYAAENVIIEDYISYEDVMPYADVYVTNGGYGGTLLSIVNELPLLAAGLHEGKNEICARIGYFNIGIDLKTETPDAKTIYDGVYEILHDKTYQENVTELSQKIKRYDGNRLCAKYIGDLLVKQQSSVSSDL